MYIILCMYICMNVCFWIKLDLETVRIFLWNVKFKCYVKEFREKWKIFVFRSMFPKHSYSLTTIYTPEKSCTSILCKFLTVTLFTVYRKKENVSNISWWHIIQWQDIYWSTQKNSHSPTPYCFDFYLCFLSYLDGLFSCLSQFGP